MRLLTSIVAVVALTAAVPAFASDISSDRYFKAQTKAHRTSSMTSSSAAQHAESKKTPSPASARPRANAPRLRARSRASCRARPGRRTCAAPPHDSGCRDARARIAPRDVSRCTACFQGARRARPRLGVHRPERPTSRSARSGDPRAVEYSSADLGALHACCARAAASRTRNARCRSDTPGTLSCPRSACRDAARSYGPLPE
jgi:hypothetical protein